MAYTAIILCVVLLLCICVRCEKQPHIIMIVADDLGFDDVSFHGSTQIATPNIDKLAKEGIILNNYYVLPSCTPTRSALMTGRYPIHNGMQSGTIYAANPWGVSLDDKLLPQYLKSVGYTTHAVGKWHLGFFAKEYTPTQRGFDTFYGFYGGQADYWDHSLASNGYWGLDLHKDTTKSSETVWTQWGNYSSKLFSMEAVDRIRNHDTNDPLFLYLSYQSVHSANLVEESLQAPQKFIDKFAHIKHRGRRKYSAMVSVMDHGIGQVYSELEKSGMLDNSIIVFTSDNGGPANGLNRNWASNYPLRGTKTTLFEGGVKAAGCVYSKLFKKSKRVSRDMMHVTDWLPTLLSMAAGDKKIPDDLKKLDGMDLSDTLQYGLPSVRKEILLNIDPLVFKNSAMIVGDWKLVNQSRFFDGWYTPPERNKKQKRKLLNHIWKNNIIPEVIYKKKSKAEIKCGPRPKKPPHCGGRKGTPCLFNLKNDPCEYRDLSKKFPIIYRIMLSKLARYRSQMVRPRRTAYRDPRANPKKRNGVWSPWIKLKNTKAKRSYFDFFNKFPSLSCSFQSN